MAGVWSFYDYHSLGMAMAMLGMLSKHTIVSLDSINLFTLTMMVFHS